MQHLVMFGHEKSPVAVGIGVQCGCWGEHGVDGVQHWNFLQGRTDRVKS